MNNLSQQIAVQDDKRPSQPMAVEDRHFPLILHDILDYSECTGNAHIVSWHPEGCAFQIHKIQTFIHILPLFFRHNSYKSFQRQLNFYAFSRIWDGPEKGKAAERFSVGSCVVSRSISSIHYLPFSFFPELS